MEYTQADTQDDEYVVIYHDHFSFKELFSIDTKCLKKCIHELSIQAKSGTIHIVHNIIISIIKLRRLLRQFISRKKLRFF